MDILAALQDDGFQSPGQQFQGGEQAGRAGADDKNGFSAMDILIFGKLIGFIRLPFPVCLHTVAVQDILPGVDGTADNDGGAHLFGLDAQSFGGRRLQLRFRQFLTNLNSNLELFHSTN